MTYEKVQDAANFIRNQFGLDPQHPIASVGVVLGSGLSSFATKVMETAQSDELTYAAIPNFPTSSVEGHKGRFIYGKVAGSPILVMDGRVHCYEGYSSQQSTFGVRVLKALGVNRIILTNAAGGINPAFNPGDLMLIRDHINLTGLNPLLGPNDDRFGPRFVDMSQAYSLRLTEIAKDCARKMDLTLREGIYLGVLGPNYETPAEIRMLDHLGASAVGMSTVLETIAARHQDMEVLGISCITNKAAGLTGGILSHEEVKDTATKTSEKFSKLLLDTVQKMTSL